MEKPNSENNLSQGKDLDISLHHLIPGQLFLKKHLVNIHLHS